MNSVKFKPIILGGYVNGYSLARTFKETYNVNSFVCDYVKQISCYSVFCDFKLVSNPQINEKKFITEMILLGNIIRKNGEIPILLVTNDIWLIPMSKNKHKFNDLFIYSFSDWNIIERLANKSMLYDYCDTIGANYPRTVKCTSVNSDYNKLLTPLLVKPSNVTSFIKHFPRIKRNNIFYDYNEVKIFLNKIFNQGYEHDMIIQEYIPGGPENLYTCSTYSDKNGILKAASVGCKLSQFPHEAGTITSGLIDYKPEVVNLTKKILEKNNFFGIANTEFKYDERDKQYRLIEVNARPGMWNYSSVLSGANLVESLIDDLFYNVPLSYKEGRDSVVWTRIPKAELLRHTKDTRNEAMVNLLISKDLIFDPLVNHNETFCYKLALFNLNLTIRLHKFYNMIKDFLISYYQKE